MWRRRSPPAVPPRSTGVVHDPVDLAPARHGSLDESLDAVGVAASARSASTSPPMAVKWPSAAARRSSSRPQMATAAPSSTSRCASASPRPSVPPVMRTTFPVSWRSITPPLPARRGSTFLLGRADEDLVHRDVARLGHGVAHAVGDVPDSMSERCRRSCGHLLEDLGAVVEASSVEVAPGSMMVTRTWRVATSWRNDSLNAPRRIWWRCRPRCCDGPPGRRPS
jgi:hypothetical protein